MSADEVIRIALAQVGKPYVWAKAGPDSFDCSGLVVYAFKRGASVDLPHFTGALWNRGQKVSRNAIAPGDLIFPTLSHVQIYIGNGKVVHAPTFGSNVSVTNLGRGFVGARRIIAPGAPVSGQQETPNDNRFIPDEIEAIAAFVEDVNRAFEWLSQADSWKRIGTFTAGFMLCLVAVTRGIA